MGPEVVGGKKSEPNSRAKVQILYRWRGGSQPSKPTMVMFFSEKKIKVAHKKLTLASLFLPGQIPNEGKFHSRNFRKGPLAPMGAIMNLYF
jgi:hypothetical protein